MIKANELRIGNLISDDDGCIAKINGFTPFSHSVRCDEAEGCILLIDVYHELTGKWKMGREADSPECNPIPLTPEWLENRLGFEVRQEPDEPLMYTILKLDLCIASMEDGYYLRTENTDPWHNTNVGRKIEYVHHIQNIYLDLVGEELNVKL
jgi:hypothetical protein